MFPRTKFSRGRCHQTPLPLLKPGSVPDKGVTPLPLPRIRVFNFKTHGLGHDSVSIGNFLELRFKIPDAEYPSSAITESIMLPNKLSSLLFLRTNRNVKVCDHVGVSCRPRGINSNTFLDSSNCFARLRKNSLPVSVVLKNNII